MSNRHSKCIAVIARALLGAGLATAALSLSAARPATAQPGADVRFGVVNAYEGSQAAYAAGVSWESVILRWDQLQSGGPSQWKSPAAIEDGLTAARSANIEVVGVLIGTPAWATDGKPGTGVPRGLYLAPTDPKNVWAAFVRQAVTYYAARGVNRFSIWRSPDIPAGSRGALWDGSMRDYYQLVKVAYVSARAANPGAIIHLGGVGNYDPTWFNAFADLIANDSTAPQHNYYFDVAMLSVYDSPEQVYALMSNHFAVMENKGIPLKEVWLGETNAPPAVDPQAYTGAPPDLRHANVTQEQQAAFIVQAYALGFAANRGARIAVYRMVDDLTADDGIAYGLLRADGSPRPAYNAYKLVVQQFSGFVYARRVSEETHPLIDYVRLTFDDRVTHVVWALTQQAATLVIPARSSQATLIDLNGNEWTVKPQNGSYRVAVAGAACNDPIDRCLIGGDPWLLVEQGVLDPLNSTPPVVTVERGGTTPTPDPSFLMTATARAIPTATPTVPTRTPTPSPTVPTATPSYTPQRTNTPLPSATSTRTPPPSSATPVPSSTPSATPTVTLTPTITLTPTDTLTPTATATATITPTPTITLTPTITPTPTPVPPDVGALRPKGFRAAMPFLLIVLGVLAIGGGLWYFLGGARRRTAPPTDDGET